jgi:hypothetical protein
LDPGRQTTAAEDGTFACIKINSETDHEYAFKAASMEAWLGHTALVPTTEHGEKFGAWDEVDPARPTLVKTGSEERLTAEQQNMAGKEQPGDVRWGGPAA